MNKGFSLAILIIGVALLIWGVNARHSLSSATAEAITGAPSMKSIWLLAGGIIATLTGLAGLARRAPTKP